MTLSDDKITEIFCQVDTFCFHFYNAPALHILGNPPKKKPKLSVSEVITLMILFHHSGYRTMKGFYRDCVKIHMRHLFSKTVSYNRYVELMASANLPLAMFVKTCYMGRCTGISFMDSTRLRVCKNKGISRNKVFDGAVALGKSTIGYFFVFKLRLVVNDKGELLNFMLTAGNVDDRHRSRIRLLGRYGEVEPVSLCAVCRVHFILNIYKINDIYNFVCACAETYKHAISIISRVTK